ncbi:MAG: hypothetical protein ACI4QT_03125 [Kiritimatiellia bacterium]
MAIPAIADFPFCNLVPFGMAVALIIHAARLMKPNYTNTGTILLLWLVLVKFYAFYIHFTPKEIFFIAVDVALAAVNMAKSNEKITKEES